METADDLRTESIDEEAPYAVERGACSIIWERKPDNAPRAWPDIAYQLFGMLTHYLPGLVITRQWPDRVRETWSLTCRVIWLADTPGKDNINPRALSQLEELIMNFIDENDGKAVVLLDGLEYLAVNNGLLQGVGANNGFLRTLMFVEHVNEFVMPWASVVLIPVDPDALEETDRAMLRRNLQVRDGTNLKADLSRREVIRRLESDRY